MLRSLLPSLLLLSLRLASPGHAADLRVGAAAVDITPEVGTPMAGYYHERPSVGVHDRLFVKALVIERGGSKAALVALDLISTTRAMVEEARAEVERATNIPGPSVMISATHAHTGPVLQSRGPREDAFGGKSPLVRKYGDDLTKKIVEAVRLADERLKPARMAAAHGTERSIAFNRRFHMADGSVGWNPGKLNPKILKPAGPIDPDVAVVHFEADDKERRPIATYVNYAVHLDNVSGAEFSADLPATLSDLLGRVKGPEMVTVYTSGCCGDINHIDVNWPERQGGHENAARMGIILAGEVLRAWPTLKAETPGALRVRSTMVKLPLAPIAPEEVEAARVTLARLNAATSDNTKGRPGFLELVKAFQVLDVEARKGEPIAVEVQVIALGDRVAWVSLPGEIFVDLGLEIKQDSPFPHTILAELANGAIGYIPARRAYKQGNYEVISARCAEGSGERLVDAAGLLLKDLHREARETAK